MPHLLPDATITRLAAHVPERNLRELRVVTGAPGRWLPVLLRTNAVTLGRRVLFREGHYRPDTKRGPPPLFYLFPSANSICVGYLTVNNPLTQI